MRLPDMDPKLYLLACCYTINLNHGTFCCIAMEPSPGLGTVSAYRHGGDQAILGEEPMAKPNVHTASRDELVEAGVRAELADEILKRRRKGAIRLEALEEVPGVGPATLEQLRQALDFREQQAAAGNGADSRANEQRGRRRTNAPVPGRTAARSDERRPREEAPARRRRRPPDQLGRAAGG